MASVPLPSKKTGPTTRREKLIAAFAEPRIRRAWARRSDRRWMVVRYLLWFVAATAAFTYMVLAQGWVGATAAALAVVLFSMPVAALGHRLQAGSRSMAGFEEVVDERQLAEIGRARALGHTVTTVVLLGLAVLAGVAQLLLHSIPERPLAVPVGLFAPLAWTLLLVHTSVPSCYLAWTQPDEDLDDQTA